MLANAKLPDLEEFRYYGGNLADLLNGDGQDLRLGCLVKLCGLLRARVRTQL